MKLPYFPRSDPIFLLEQSVKIREIVKSTLFSNFQDGVGRGSQQLVSHGQPIVVEVVDKTCFHMSFEKLHKMVQHTKQDAKAGLAYMKWYEIKQLAQEEGELLAIIKLVKKMLQQGWDVVEIADLVERPVEWIKKVEKVVRAHTDWNEEEISQTLTERPLTESLK